MFSFLAGLFRLHQKPASAAHQREPQSGAPLAAQEESDAGANLVVVRQAVLTRDKKVAGYEFSLAENIGFGESDPEQARAFLQFLESVPGSAMLGKRRAFAALPQTLLFDPRLEKLAHDGVIVLLRFAPDARDLDRVAERMQAMRAAGMLLGLADARVALAHPAFGDCSSIGFLPVDQIIPPDLLQSVRLLSKRHPQMKLCASGVNSYEEFEVCRRLRLHGFIGPFASHRRDWQNNTIDPGTLRLCKVVNSLRAGAEMDAVIKEIKLDPLLSYRILCYANSAAIGAQHKILALKDAILLIGREPLFRWLVLLLCASAPAHREDGALLENALVRGRLMEILARKGSQAPPEICFFTGVLSLLDVILQLPAAALFDALDLPEEVKVALVERKGPYGSLLQLAEASELSRAEGIGALCAELGIAPAMLGEAQTEALIWARGQTQDGDVEDATFVTEPTLPDALPAIEPQPALAGSESAPPVSLAAIPDPELAAAQRGEPAAQCALGARYARGDGVARDLTQALAWYTRSAEQGSANAQWNLALMHARGQGGLDPDVREAAQWCQKAAEQGFAPAQATLGRMYASGQGVEKDSARARQLFQEAAQQGDMEAQYNLAVQYEQGASGEHDLAQALLWFSRAAEQGLPAAQERLGLMYAIGQSIAQDLIEAHKWFSIASEGGDLAAKANLAHSLTLMEADQVQEAERRARLWLQNRVADAAC
jgi:TPR repeat protein/c-di-GMP-related signal transduction protein